MADVEQIADHYERAVARLAVQFRDKPHFLGILRAFARQVQQVEDMFHGILTGFRLDTPAVGAQLDVIGRVIGQARESADDAEYLLRLSARVRANFSKGSVEDLYTVFKILLPGHTIGIEPAYPAAFIMRIIEAIDEDLIPLYQRFFQDTKAAGVGAQLEYSLTAPSTSFTLSSVADFGVDGATKGLADTALTSGGRLAGVF